jgi:hypothetical protein
MHAVYCDLFQRLSGQIMLNFRLPCQDASKDMITQFAQHVRRFLAAAMFIDMSIFAIWPG